MIYSNCLVAIATETALGFRKRINAYLGNPKFAANFIFKRVTSAYFIVNQLRVFITAIVI